jgi:hypothetical protein
LLWIALRAKPAILAATTTHRRLVILRARSTTEPASSTATSGIALTVPVLRGVSAETTPAAIHHGRRAAWSAAASTKSLPTVAAWALLWIALRAKSAVLAATATHRRLVILRARGATESAASAATSGIALTVPVLGTVSPETTPAATHHGWRAVWSAAASTKSLLTVAAWTLLWITLRAKPAVLAATATHRRLVILRARSATEPASSTATSGIALTGPVLRAVSPETTPAATHHGRRAAWSAAASTKSLLTVAAWTLLWITLRAKPAVLAATATHRRLVILRAGSTTELLLPTSTTIAAPRWRRLGGLVAEFCAPALHHALACLLWSEVAPGRALPVRPDRASLSL